MMKYDLGVRCDYFLSMKKNSEVHRDVFLGVSGGRIKKIAPWSTGKWEVGHWLKAENQVVMPGLINGHTHLPMTLFRGLADDQPFDKWLHETIVPLEKKVVNPDFVRVGTELAAIESILAGTTMVCDMYFFEDQIADVLDRAGLRAYVAEAFASFPTPDNPKQDDSNFRIFESLQSHYAQHSRITACLGPHAPYSCDDSLLTEMGEVSWKSKAPILIHVSETKSEVSESLKQYKKTPIERLANLGLFERNTIIAHGVHPTEADISILRETQTSVIHNPESNMKLGSGIAPVHEYLKQGVSVGLGTDGAASNNDLCLFGEMDVAAKLQKLAFHDNAAISARQVLEMATILGARALGLESEIGSLEEGKKADFITVDLSEPHTNPINDLESILVYSCTGHEVRNVVCDGKVLMEDRVLTTLNPNETLKKVHQYQEKIKDLV